MAMPWSMAIWIANMVWVGLIGLVSTCLIVADELASSLRTGDIGPFHHGFLSVFVSVSSEIYVLSSKLLVIRIKETTFTAHVVFSTCLV
uniref:Uncharacterized protein n=1 Tax=Salix viminalis TaxID=40686 RepID=A0A6N2K0E7_SALVM